MTFLHGILENFPEELSSRMPLDYFFPARKLNLSFHELFLYLRKQYLSSYIKSVIYFQHVFIYYSK